MPDFTPQPNPPAMRQNQTAKPVAPAGTHEDPLRPGEYIKNDVPFGEHEDPMRPGQYLKNEVPVGEHEDPLRTGVYIKDAPKDVKPTTIGQKKVLVQNPPGPEAVEEKPSTETVTVLEGDFYVGLDQIHQGIKILANHSAAGIVGSIISEAVTLLQAGEAKLTGLELK